MYIDYEIDAKKCLKYEISYLVYAYRSLDILFCNTTRWNFDDIMNGKLKCIKRSNNHMKISPFQNENN